jgi:hypothetical protein
MKDHTTNSSNRKTPGDLLLRVLSTIGSKIFEENDRRARDQGWQIVQRRRGLGRSYRDPRFDYLIACTACNGRGCNPRGIACSDCGGAGRIILTPTAVSQLGRGQL